MGNLILQLFCVVLLLSHEFVHSNPRAGEQAEEPDGSMVMNAPKGGGDGNSSMKDIRGGSRQGVCQCADEDIRELRIKYQTFLACVTDLLRQMDGIQTLVTEIPDLMLRLGAFEEEAFPDVYTLQCRESVRGSISIFPTLVTTVRCRPGCGNYFPGYLWGDEIYSDDSRICAAAVHDGRILENHGGIVHIKKLPGKQSYPASEKNGVISKIGGAWHGSFKFCNSRSC